MHRARADAARSAGLLGALALLTDVADELVVGTVRDVHVAVADRVAGRSRSGAVGGVTRSTHDRISGAVYGGVGRGLRAASTWLHAADRRGVGAPVERTSSGRFAVAAVNGLIGDRLSAGRSPMAIRMAVRHQGRDVPPDREGLADAFPGASGDVVVFVHGLSESEQSWLRHADRTGGSYGARLAADTSWTPVYLRVNTGLSITENAAALAGLLDDVVAAWPVPVRRIAFVGHSMGGLIVRAACAVVTEARPGRPAWNTLVTHVVTLGTPHLGAPLERGVALGSTALRRIPEAAPFGRILEYRSVGILNLRGGLAPDVQNLPHASYHLVAATLAGSPRHPVSALLGDLLVRYPSALGRPRRGPAMFPDADVLHVRGGHFRLLNHPEVYDALRRWLD